MKARYKSHWQRREIDEYRWKKLYDDIFTVEHKPGRDMGSCRIKPKKQYVRPEDVEDFV